MSKDSGDFFVVCSMSDKAYAYTKLKIWRHIRRAMKASLERKIQTLNLQLTKITYTHRHTEYLDANGDTYSGWELRADGHTN